MNFDIDKMSIQELREIMKIILRVTNADSYRIDILQDRVLALEMELGDKK